MTTEAASRSPELQEVLRIAIEYFIRDVNVSLPGQVESYEASTQKATVKPLVQRLIAGADGEEILEGLPAIPGVPVVFPRAGGFFMSMPVAKGDHCLLVFNSFPIDKFKAGDGKDSSPEDFSTHDLSDAVALMGFAPFSKAIKEADPDKMVMGKDGGMQVSIDPQGVLIMAALNAATQAVALATKVESELSSIATALSSHTHTGVLAGGGMTGPPAAPPYTAGAVGSSKVSAEE